MMVCCVLIEHRQAFEQALIDADGVGIGGSRGVDLWRAIAHRHLLSDGRERQGDAQRGRRPRSDRHSHRRRLKPGKRHMEVVAAGRDVLEAERARSVRGRLTIARSARGQDDLSSRQHRTARIDRHASEYLGRGSRLRGERRRRAEQHRRDKQWDGHRRANESWHRVCRRSTTRQSEKRGCYQIADERTMKARMGARTEPRRVRR
jgi:hypothetical protein